MTLHVGINLKKRKILFVCTAILSLVLSMHMTLARNTFKKVALVSVSTQFNQEKIPYVIKSLKNKGYDVTTQYLYGFPFQDLGYADAESVRAKSILSAFTDPAIDIVWFVRGGGGALNLLPYLNQQVNVLKKVSPKVVVGFSDVTAIHNFVNDKLGWTSVHGVLAALNKDLYAILPGRLRGNPSIPKINDQQPIPSIASLYKRGVIYKHVMPLNLAAKNSVSAELVGGNFTLVYSTFSTKYEPDWSGKVLLLEDVGVSPRQLDRSLHQLLFKKHLDVKAILFGRFFSLTPSTQEILIFKTALEKFAEKFHKPVYYYPTIGHGRRNVPLLLGANVSITCKTDEHYCHLIQKGATLQ